MKMLLAVMTLLVTLAYPSLSQAQIQYQQVCENGVCRLVPVQQRPQRITYARPAMFVKTVALIADDVDTPRVAISSPFQFASMQVVQAPFTANAATPALVQSAGSNCGCAVNGVCSCPLGTCQCVGCTCAAMGLQMAAQPTAITYASYLASSPMFASVSENVIQTPTGHVHVAQDAFGNTMISHTGGHQQRKIARHERWKARHGIQ